MRFKAGDKVRVKKFKERPKHWNSYGDMDHLMGKIVKIKGIVSFGRYAVYDSKANYIWHFDENDLEPVNETIVIYSKDREVIALDKATGNKAIARCNPVDEYDFRVGAKLAFERLIKEKSNKVQLSELKPGETFKIGKHDFIVLDHVGNTTKVISKGFMAENVVFDRDSKDYNTSNLKKVIERDIQPVIEAEVGAENIIEHSVDLTSVDMQSKYKDCTCKVRPVTFNEARRYNDLLVNKDLDDWWWTCTPWSTSDREYNYSITVVAPSGFISYVGCRYDRGVRPFCILKSNIFVSKKGE